MEHLTNQGSFAPLPPTAPQKGGRRKEGARCLGGVDPGGGWPPHVRGGRRSGVAAVVGEWPSLRGLDGGRGQQGLRVAAARKARLPSGAGDGRRKGTTAAGGWTPPGGPGHRRGVATKVGSRRRRGRRRGGVASVWKR